MDVSLWVMAGAIVQIILIDIVLSGDNAVVIALACRNLPPPQRRLGVFWGVCGAVVLRVALTAFAAGVLGYPYLRLVGGALLLWIGVKLLMPEDAGHDIPASDRLWGAVKTVILADLVMSLDNIVAVAGAAQGSLLLLLFGLAVSIPLIVWSSTWVMHWMERFPIVVTLGAALLGYIGGGMLVSDPIIREVWGEMSPWWPRVVGGLAALGVVLLGKRLAARTKSVLDRAIE